MKAKFVVTKSKTDIPVHFNPSEYSISIAGGGEVKETRSSARRKQPVSSRSLETLKLVLYFDTYTQYVNSGEESDYERKGTCEDVRIYTESIANLVGRNGKPAQHISFVWGSLIFPGTIKSVSLTFTMFMDDGKPVRAKMDMQIDKSTEAEVKNLDKGTKAVLDLTDTDWKKNLSKMATDGKLREALEGFLGG